MSDLDISGLDSTNKLCQSRSYAILNALHKNTDFELLDIKRWNTNDGTELDLFLVTLECDGVPDVDARGIQYRESLGILVGPEEFVPEVWALRADFPLLIHLNERSDLPNSLCLYFENPTVVNRTWTAEKFLKRIYWWIEKSAKGELHPSDQPVEQFFFDSPYELVLPMDMGLSFDALAENSTISNSHIRSDGTCTFFLNQVTEANTEVNNAGVSAKVIVLNLPVITQGHISATPKNLSYLFETRADSGSLCVDHIRDHIHSLIPKDGLAEEVGECRTVIIVRIPISRSEGEKTERVQVKAFLTVESLIEIGEKSGFLFKSPVDGNYFIDHAGGEDLSSTIEIFPVDVLKLNSKTDYSFQSGIEDNNDHFTLIGLGALGSSLFDLWNRAGWGEWTLVDKDHIKPHNLTRHMGEIPFIGWNKATAAASRALSATGNVSGLSPIGADALKLEGDKRDAVNKSSLVIDASTTLDYPRKASFDENSPRHVSVFITPSGVDSVLLLEDVDRHSRLRILESQYYRHVIVADWGEHHLVGNLGNFISGASCRDISLKLPFTAVTGHASILAEQIMLRADSTSASINVWRKNVSAGTVESHACEVTNELCQDIGDIKVFYDAGLEEKIYTLREEMLPCETGGVLVGYHDLNLKAVFIVDAFRPPPDSDQTPTSFKRGTLGVMESVEDARERTANIVDYIGEWHSHPKDVDADPSRKDIIQLSQLAMHLSEDGLPAIQLIAGESGINILMGKTIGERE